MHTDAAIIGRGQSAYTPAGPEPGPVDGHLHSATAVSPRSPTPPSTRAISIGMAVACSRWRLMQGGPRLEARLSLRWLIAASVCMIFWVEPR